MSEEICEELKTILKKSQPDGFMGLDGNDLATIREKAKSLSFDERASLFINFIPVAGTILYDAGDIFEARIRIDDKHTKASENRPLAYIKFSDGYKARVEVIDILESVRTDATLIGHPAILFAIDYWQQILIWEKYIKSENIYSEAEINKTLNYGFFERYIESARANLESIGKALLEGARRQAISKEMALSLKTEEIRLEKKNTFLFVAWERLAVKQMNESEEPDERINRIEKYLRQLTSYQSMKRLDEFPIELQKYGVIDSTISISTVIDFLKTDGNKFVLHKSSEKSQRPRWKVFQNAYFKWYFKKEPSTLEKYKRIADNQEIRGQFRKPDFFGKLPGVNIYHFISDVFSRPLVNYRPPIECSNQMADSRRFAELIDQTKTK